MLGVTGATVTDRVAGRAPREMHVAAPVHGGRIARRVLRLLLVAIPLVLAGYALDDRGFAYVASVPGTPIFAAEVLLLLGLLYVSVATGYLRAALRGSLPLGLLLIFIAWGLARTLPLIPVYGLDSVRDAALWYYALMAVLIATLMAAAPDLLHRWVRAYAPFLVVLLLWSPVAVMLYASTTPTVPLTGVPLFSHKPGNIAVAAATTVAFLWLVPTHSLGRRLRLLLTALATVVILAVGTQNRAGLLAALAGVVMTAALMTGGRRTMAMTIIGTVLIGLLVGWGLDLHITGRQGRDYSVAQLFDNATSLTGGQSTGTLGATVQFRDQLWSGVVTLAEGRGALVTGLGFGPNLAQQLGVSLGAGDPLRSPHNSHIDVVARMGIVGGVLWLGFWTAWYVEMFRRLRLGGSSLEPEHRGLLKVCIVGVTAILINAYFDPTLESPQVALWLWTLVGLGLGIASRRSVAPQGNVVTDAQPA